MGPLCKLPLLLLLSSQQDWAPLINPTALGRQGATHLPDTILLLSGASPQKDGPFPQRVEPLLGSPLRLSSAPPSILGLCSLHGGPPGPAQEPASEGVAVNWRQEMSKVVLDSSLALGRPPPLSHVGPVRRGGLHGTTRPTYFSPGHSTHNLCPQATDRKTPRRSRNQASDGLYSPMGGAAGPKPSKPSTGPAHRPALPARLLPPATLPATSL